MIGYIRELFGGVVQGPFHQVAVDGLMALLIVVCAVAAYYVTRVLLQVIERLILRSPTEWDDDLLTPRFLRAVSQLAPAIVVAWMLPRCFGDSPGSVMWLDGLTSLYILWAIVMILVIFIDNLYLAFTKRGKLHAYAVKGIFQMFKLIVIGVAVIIALSILIGKTPVAILTALGSSAAVLMLVFKDTILGLVASVQLTANNMLRKGDSIVVPKHFQNYQPMQVSGGRRVCRAFYVDVNTVRFCTREELEHLRARGWLEGIDMADAGHIVNLQLLRRYLDRYLAMHPEVNPELTYMVRQLDPTTSGLPLQLYFFTRTTAWKEYERIQADVFDHVYAVVGHFGLSVFQTPAGRDFVPPQDEEVGS